MNLSRPIGPSSFRVVALTVVLALPASLGAQDVREERPYRGLFGGDAAESGPGQSLSVNWSLFGAYDDNATPEAGGLTDPRYQMQGAFSTGNASLAYAARGEKASLTVNAASGGRYYPELRQLTSFEGSGGVGFVASLGGRARISAAENINYRPYYQFDFLTVLAPGGAAPAVSGAEGLITRQSVDHDGRIDLRTEIGGRSSFTVDYGYRRTQFVDSDERFTWQLANARFGHNVTRNAALRAGYGYGRSHNSVGQSGPEQEHHNIELGVDYRRPLSFSRRTSMTFGSGSTLVEEENGRHFHLLADAGLTHEIGRTWNARVAYHRGVQFIPGFNEPVLADHVNTSVGGLISRRTSALIAAGYASGQLGAIHGEKYATYSGNGGVQIALNRLFALTAQYSYYQYDVAAAVDLPVAVPRRLHRHAFRVGLSGWLPLFR